MTRDVWVLIVEDDPYARDLMLLLLTRDWHTRVAGEASNQAEALHILAQSTRHMVRVDVILLDTEIPEDPDWSFRVARAARSGPHPPVVLCTGTRASRRTLERSLREGFGGYILKGEIRYALASAVRLAASGYWVITPGVLDVVHAGIMFPREVKVLDGRKPVANFTPRENEIARLAVLFNLAQRDLADELHIGANWVARVVSQIYEKLGLREILTHEIEVEEYFEGVLLERIKEIQNRMVAQPSDVPAGGERARKAPEMSTLAFHLLTVPEVVKEV